MCQPGWEGRLEENGYMFNTVMVTCMAESLHPCSLETITTLLTGYTQYKIKSIKFEKKKKKKSFLIGNTYTALDPGLAS